MRIGNNISERISFFIFYTNTFVQRGATQNHTNPFRNLLVFYNLCSNPFIESNKNRVSIFIHLPCLYVLFAIMLFISLFLFITGYDNSNLFLQTVIQQKLILLLNRISIVFFFFSFRFLHHHHLSYQCL